MREALGEALEHIGLRMERGLEEAERELSEVRERCSTLEEQIRSIRAALEAVAPDPDVPPPNPEAAGGPQAAVAPDGDPDRIERLEVRDEEAEIVITIPPGPPETDGANEGSNERSNEPEEPAAEETPSVPAYMPMLEELWAIARRSDD